VPAAQGRAEFDPLLTFPIAPVRAENTRKLPYTRYCSLAPGTTVRKQAANASERADLRERQTLDLRATSSCLFGCLSGPRLPLTQMSSETVCGRTFAGT
jgi:hypothetical protein